MKTLRISPLVLLWAISIFSAGTAQAQIRLGLGGSFANATGSGDNSDETAQNGGGYLWVRYQISDRIVAGAQLSVYTGSDSDEANVLFVQAPGNYAIIGTFLTAEYIFRPESRLQPFVMVLLGAYQSEVERYKTLFTQGETTIESESFFAGGAGAGLRYALSDHFDLEASVQAQSTERSVVIPVNIGFMYKFLKRTDR